MYAYNETDRQIVRERVAQFRDQTARYLAGELDDEQFRPLRLQNGLYYQRHNPLLRIAIPYGQLSARQLRMLAHVTRTYDRGVAHFTTRQNFQLNWVRVDQVPDILAELAQVDMHAIQSSGSCIRVVTTDPFAGVAPDAVADQRPWCEIFRQWSTLHPEFLMLPRKYKVAFTGGPMDEAGVSIHDLGFELTRSGDGEFGFRVWIGGGLGRTPILAKKLRDFLSWRHLLTYAEAVMRVYNLHGRRDNIFKARIKILVQTLGIAEFTRQVEAEWSHLEDGPHTLTQAEVARIQAHFAAPAYESLSATDARFELARRADREFAVWVTSNTHHHRQPGYAVVTLPLKHPDAAPGDATAGQLDIVADLAERYSFGELRSTQTQNLLLPHVRLCDLHALWQEARRAKLATATTGLLNDMVTCPGADFCGLASARSISIARAIHARFPDLSELLDIGPLRLHISGCVNSCSHHHVGAIGILGLSKSGEEWYQITLGGAIGARPALGKRIGPSVCAADVPDVIGRIVEYYRTCRWPHETFMQTLERIGHRKFSAAAYGDSPTLNHERELEHG